MRLKWMQTYNHVHSHAEAIISHTFKLFDSNNSFWGRKLPQSPRTITAVATLWQQIELEAYESCYTSPQKLMWS